MKIYFFIEDTHLPQKISKCISGHVLANKIEEFYKCDDFGGEISRSPIYIPRFE
jgi:hypothetical protein